MNQHDGTIKLVAKMYDRYMDDILRPIKKHLVDRKLNEINKLHPNLKFTIEFEQDGKLSFLDMCIVYRGKKLHSTWYTKPSDTELIMNFHALAPRKYKRSVVQGFVHRIHRACSDWIFFNEGLQEAKRILEHNQYSPEIYDPIIATTIEKFVGQLAVHDYRR